MDGPLKRFINALLPAGIFSLVIIYLIVANIPPFKILPHVDPTPQNTAATSIAKVAPTVQVILTTVDQKNTLTPQNPVIFSNENVSLSETTITIDDHKTYQRILGFGASLTGSSIWEMENKLTPQQRNTLMQKLFNPVSGIGINLLRQPIGASDQDAPGESPPSGFCSYDDNGGEVDDANLSHFSILHDVSSHTIDLLQQAMSLNPQINIIAAPWCIPQWMITTIRGVSTLNPAYYGLFSEYLVKYAQAYDAQKPSIPIWAIIPQNEPLYSYANLGNNMTATQEGNLIAQNLGPTLKQAGLNSGILIYDHNWDHPEYPEQILGGPAAQYVMGTSWHKYAGNVDAQSEVHNMYPDKGTFFTEDSPPTFDTNWGQYMPEAANRMIDVLQNWSESYMQWTLVSNTQFGPGTCTLCGADAYINDATGEITFSLPYYLLGQFSKYVKPQSYRIDSTDLGTGNIRSVAFKNPNGSIALVAYNDSSAVQTFNVNWAGYSFSYALPSNAIATFTWPTTH